jgi:Zn-finger nucleic acid-binding protein
MVAFQLEGVEIDHCLACRGTWLDAGELEQLTELAGAPSGELSRALEFSREGSRTRRRCPRCPRRLREITIHDVVVDRCPSGHGLWLDEGEMETVTRSATGGQAGEVARFFKDLYRSELDSSKRGD